jgi:acetyl-CoA C-acetyltransferase
MKKNNPQDIVIVSAVRTPFSKFDTAMADIPSIRLATIVMKEALGRTNVKPEEIDDMEYGSCILPELSLETDCPARQASLILGWPESLLSNTMDRACCSSLSALRTSVNFIKAGEAEICMAVGSENMPRAPHIAPGLRKGVRLGHIRLIDTIFQLGYVESGASPVAQDAGEIAVQNGITREMQDEWAVISQERYAKAYAAGIYKVGEEIVPVVIPQKKGDPIVIDKDESPRKTSMELLAKLPTIYGSPTCTAGNAPPLSAGASAILFMPRKRAEEKGLKPIATIVDTVAYAMSPRYISETPAGAINKTLKRTGLTIDQMDVIEINEAFAAVTLTSTKLLANGDPKKWEELKAKTNIHGGAIALGHPVGATAARITMHLAYELQRRGGGYGVAAICGGLAQGEAIILRAEE